MPLPLIVGILHHAEKAAELQGSRNGKKLSPRAQFSNLF
jgi:hypothetical protein